MDEKIKIITIDAASKAGGLLAETIIEKYYKKHILKIPSEGDLRIVSNGIKFAIEEYREVTQTNLLYLVLFIRKYEWRINGEYFKTFEEADRWVKRVEEENRSANLEWKVVTNG